MARIFIITLLLFTGNFAVYAGPGAIQQEVFSVPYSGLVTALASPELISDSDEQSDWALFIGRFHPVFVHLPIGFLLLAFLLEYVGMIRRYKDLQHAVPFTLLMGCLSGILAGVTGYLLSTGGGYGEDALAIHKWMGIGMVVLSGGAFILRITMYEDEIYRRIFRFLLIVIVALVMGTGHFGGNLTHGSDYLFRYMPEPFRSWVGYEIREEGEQIALIENLEEAFVYKDIIEPILTTRCESCHNPDRTEAELLLTSYNQLMAGGESGPAVVLHNPADSELYTRLILPERDEKRMPPRGRTQLTGDQVKLIAWWIEQGAPSEVTVPEVDARGEIEDILQKLTAVGQDFFERIVVARAEDQLLDRAKEKGFRIIPIAEHINFLQVQVSKSLQSLTAEDMEVLLPLSDQIIWLDLSRLRIGDEVLQTISQFRHLRRLSIQQTAITDSTLMIIGGLEHLEYLNIYGTQITNKGLNHLDSLPALKTIYVWQTKVSSTGIEELQKRMPELYIDTGWGNKENNQDVPGSISVN